MDINPHRGSQGIGVHFLGCDDDILSVEENVLVLRRHQLECLRRKHCDVFNSLQVVQKKNKGEIKLMWNPG